YHSSLYFTLLLLSYIFTLSLHDALPILGQFSGRVQQTYKHSVPRFFVPEHGTMFTLALVRFPPTATKEIQYLNAKGTESLYSPSAENRSVERFCRNAKTELVCRHQLEK